MKENQGNLYQDIEAWFQYADQVAFKDMNHSHDRTVNKGHGHIEIRDCWVVSDPLAFEDIHHHEGWADLTSIARVVRHRRIGDEKTTETTYYISSLPNKADLLLPCSRAHWSVENSLHWVLDVTFREDESRVRVGNAPQNFAVLRHLALNILKKDTTKGSLKQKRFRAALDDTFLFQLLDQV